jgi:hypothetical protein
LVDVFRIFNRGLNASEVAALAIPAPAEIISHSNPFSTWAAAYSFPPGKGEPMIDADGDGMENLIEFVMGGDPLVADPDKLPRGVLMAGGSLDALADPGMTYLTFDVRQRKLRGNVLVIAEAASDLAAFSTDGTMNASQVGAPVDEGEFEVIRYRYPVPIEESLKGFLRVKVINAN